MDPYTDVEGGVQASQKDYVDKKPYDQINMTVHFTLFLIPCSYEHSMPCC